MNFAIFLAAKPFGDNPRQKQGIAQEVAAGFVARLLAQPPGPFVPDFLQPGRGAADVARPEIEQPADAQANRCVEPAELRSYPAFLQRIAHADQQHVGPGGVDRVEDRGIQLGIIQISVMIAREPPAGEVLPGVARGLRNRRLIAAEHEVRIIPAGGRFEQERREVGALQVVANANAVQPRPPTHAGSIAEDEIAGIEHFAISRIGRREIQRMGVDEKHAARAAVAAADDFFQKLHAALLAEVENMHPQHGETRFGLESRAAAVGRCWFGSRCLPCVHGVDLVE